MGYYLLNSWRVFGGLDSGKRWAPGRGGQWFSRNPGVTAWAVTRPQRLSARHYRTARLPSDMDARMVRTQKTSIGGRVFAVSALKNPPSHVYPSALTQRPKNPASADLGSARFGRVGEFWSCFAVWGDDPRRDKLDSIVR